MPCSLSESDQHIPSPFVEKYELTNPQAFLSRKDTIMYGAFKMSWDASSCWLDPILAIFYFAWRRGTYTYDITTRHGSAVQEVQSVMRVFVGLRPTPSLYGRSFTGCMNALLMGGRWDKSEITSGPSSC